MAACHETQHDGDGEQDGLYQRGRRGGSRVMKARASKPDVIPWDAAWTASVKSRQQKFSEEEEELPIPEDLVGLWQKLLEDLLPGQPDKKAIVQKNWESLTNDMDRYIMYLEYLSFLRPENSDPAEAARRRRELEPMMRELGLDTDDNESLSAGTTAWILFMGLLVICGSVVYYLIVRPELDQGP